MFRISMSIITHFLLPLLCSSGSNSPSSLFLPSRAENIDYSILLWLIRKQKLRFPPSPSREINSTRKMETTGDTLRLWHLLCATLCIRPASICINFNADIRKGVVINGLNKCTPFFKWLWEFEMRFVKCVGVWYAYDSRSFYCYKIKNFRKTFI